MPGTTTAGETAAMTKPRVPPGRRDGLRWRWRVAAPRAATEGLRGWAHPTPRIPGGRGSKRQEDAPPRRRAGCAPDFAPLGRRVADSGGGGSGGGGGDVPTGAWQPGQYF
eukprot:scaffold16620_cov58-Phaeocystis_antarctica.AAC.3